MQNALQRRTVSLYLICLKHAKKHAMDMPKMKKKKSSSSAKLQTLGLTGSFYEKTSFFAKFSSNKCEKQQDTVPLYIAKGFQTDIKFLLL